MDYYLRDGGQWVAKNEAYQAGSGDAETFGYRFEWGLNRQYVKITIFGNHADGKKTDYWEVIAAWDPKSKKIVLSQFGGNGAVLNGVEHFEENGNSKIEMSGWLADGSPFAFRDESVRLGPDSFRSTTFMESDGAWQPIQSMTWRRTAD